MFFFASGAAGGFFLSGDYDKIRGEYAEEERIPMEEFRLLVINPGSTSTKISLFVNEQEMFCKSRFH